MAYDPNIAGRRAWFPDRYAEMTSDPERAWITPEQLTDDERASIPEAWIDIVSDQQNAPAAVAQLWRDHAPTMTRIPGWIERSLIGVSLVRREYSSAHYMDAGKGEVRDIALHYSFPDASFPPEELELRNLRTLIGSAPYQGPHPPHWNALTSAIGTLYSDLHNGLTEYKFHGWLPISQQHSAHVHWDFLEHIQFSDANFNDLGEGPSLNDVIVIAENDALIVGIDQTQTNSLGWAGSSDFLCHRNAAEEMENLIGRISRAFDYDPHFTRPDWQG